MQASRVSKIVPIFRDMVFEPELLWSMGEAHDRACKQLNRVDDLAKQAVAQRIIHLAMSGERDATVLCDRVFDREANLVIAWKEVAIDVTCTES